MKKPDEIKKDLIDCMEEAIEVGQTCDVQVLLDFSDKAYVCMATTRAYIQQLEAANAEKDKRIAELEQELEAAKLQRDAAVADMKQAQGCICNICKNHYRPDPAARRYECKILGKFSEIFDDDDGGALLCGKFEWRGVCPENTEVQKDG